MLAHWYMAKAVKALYMPVFVVLEIQQVYWKTWHEVMK